MRRVCTCMNVARGRTRRSLSLSFSSSPPHYWMFGGGLLKWILSEVGARPPGEMGLKCCAGRSRRLSLQCVLISRRIYRCPGTDYRDPSAEMLRFSFRRCRRSVRPDVAARARTSCWAANPYTHTHTRTHTLSLCVCVFS